MGDTVKCEICNNFNDDGWTTFPRYLREDELRTSAETCQTCDILLEGCQKAWGNGFQFQFYVRKTKESVLKVVASPSGENLFFHSRRDRQGNKLEDSEYSIGGATVWKAIKEYEPPEENVTPGHYVRLIKEYMDQCERDHAACKSHQEQAITDFITPSRLLYVGHLAPHHSPVLYEPTRDSGSLYGTGTPYIALSHCWGSGQHITTTKATLADRKNAIDWFSLSKTFQEAIIMTRLLGIDYLWIDSLCIIQDDIDDWAKEASRMHSVYHNAYLTFAATGAADGSEGLFPPRRPKTYRLQRTIDKGRPYALHVFKVPVHQKLDVLSGNATPGFPLHSRAWAFQEQLFSPRYVSFTQEEMAWECFERYSCECKDNLWERAFGADRNYAQYRTLRYRAHDTNDDIEDRMKTWLRLISNFSTRGITHHQDRLPAISSLAWLFESSGNKYLAGMWESDLAFGLLWQVEPSSSSANMLAAPTKTTSSLSSLPPSWSWASVEGSEISWNNLEWHFESEVQILEADTHPTTSDPRGVISGGHITLTGQLYQVQLVLHQNSEIKIRFKPRIRDIDVQGTDNVEFPCKWDRAADLECLQKDEIAQKELYFLLVGTNTREDVQGLVLKALDEPTLAQSDVGRRMESAYLLERIGASKLLKFDRSGFVCTTATVTIF